MTMILSNVNNDDRVTSLAVSHTWSSAARAIIHETEIDKLTQLLDSMLIKPCPKVERRYLIRMHLREHEYTADNVMYTCARCGGSARGILVCGCHLRVCHKYERFPWCTVLIGPALALTAITLTAIALTGKRQVSVGFRKIKA